MQPPRTVIHLLEHNVRVHELLVLLWRDEVWVGDALAKVRRQRVHRAAELSVSAAEVAEVHVLERDGCAGMDE